MNLSELASKIKKISDELRRPNLTTEDKGLLVIAKDKLNQAMTIEEAAAKEALVTLHNKKVCEVEYQYEEAKKAASTYNNAIQKELLNVQKGFESIERANKLIEKYSRVMYSIKVNEDNKAHPKTSQHSIYLQTKHIKTSIVCDFFNALGVSFKNIDQYKGYYLTIGSKKNNVNELLDRLAELKISKVNVKQWYLDYHSEESQMSQDVQALIKEGL